eukprot:175029-Rhodomonas_salina.1
MVCFRCTVPGYPSGQRRSRDLAWQALRRILGRVVYLICIAHPPRKVAHTGIKVSISRNSYWKLETQVPGVIRYLGTWWKFLAVLVPGYAVCFVAFESRGRDLCTRTPTTTRKSGRFYPARVL